ncbi:FAS1-like dehydratase domain-containing protein [Amycolatopsis sp.]|uniref:FAS1-like dehydratase domain-containing protein n=1 Tax=Amycolatopsis sp. TaxID=37632 RepID=UPI002BEFFD3C|nr:MaoC family dehydratase N-terminal domain-containing protein [Amycolatopsis sp.]HVV07969.1 MaoC family dehydratase N-terminal domain-containing protein [Amycolatopsis sp.]
MEILDEVSFDVERGKIREFALATHATDPVHTSIDAAHAAGFPDVPATATHVVVAGHHRDQRAFVAKLGLAFDRVVVGSVKWTYLRPLCAGDSLRGVRRVASDTRKRELRFVTLETDYLDASGHCAVRVREVLIERGAR